ncbi:hypothetical protein MTR67_043083 [Solanum verrucosum]|uniref:Uncharacterized protein n=1 Tax=Solanum verrucosum TaxID=315347 RepID=A0AAF0ZTZ1_SOLVR|nr:hypothetical protein MTR67_043083 [Solanum verrucosum]
MPSHEGRNQVGDEKEQSANQRAVPRCKARSPKVTELEDVECQSKMEMEEINGRFTEWFGEPDLVRQLALRGLFLVTII